jgi:hypothetical protein
MGLSLSRKGETSLDLSYEFWSTVLELAREYGWEPLGCRDIMLDHREDKATGNWLRVSDAEVIVIEGDYSTAGVISGADAKRMVEALQTAIEDLMRIPTGWRKLLIHDIDFIRTISNFIRKGEFVIS